jgi:hypothetical protein
LYPCWAPRKPHVSSSRAACQPKGIRSLPANERLPCGATWSSRRKSAAGVVQRVISGSAGTGPVRRRPQRIRALVALGDLTPGGFGVRGAASLRRRLRQARRGGPLPDFRTTLSRLALTRQYGNRIRARRLRGALARPSAARCEALALGMSRIYAASASRPDRQQVRRRAETPGNGMRGEGKPR